ncbi:MAG: DNA gyrase subunit A [Clostridia bacterium]|nr:DNA gyrase subunit A [Clostridia bacterium]
MYYDDNDNNNGISTPDDLPEEISGSSDGAAEENSAEESSENLEFAHQRITEVSMEKEVRRSFLEYSMSVIISRALPDVRDGMKPVHRRILYAMWEDHLTYQNPFRKSATTVGNVLGRYHPHGDTSVYDAMVRLAQPFNMRYPLVEGHGNFGNVDGDGPAAYRYTEARMSRMADDMLTDIKKDVVDMVPNFDNKRVEPSVLPSRFPNLLVNGSVGIAVGMATNIPPHNLGEVIDGINMYMDNPDVTINDLMTVIKGPDFPTAAMICGTSGIRETYLTGKGHIIVRARAEVEENKHRIVVTEIPYAVNKAMLVTAMADCVKDKKIDGITAIRDESGRDGMRIVVEYRRDAQGQVILNQLYKYTQLQDTFAANMLALVPTPNGAVEPKILNLKQMISYYAEHQINVVTRRVKYDLNAALDEAHIYEGYKIAIDNIDEVIQIIRSSANIPESKARLMERFSLSDPQAQAIVDMTLGHLSGLEREKVEQHLRELHELIAKLQAILGDEGAIKQIIKDDLQRIRDRFGDARRTELVPMANEIVPEDLIERRTDVITLSGAGYIKRMPADEYTAQRRGGKGVIGMTTKDEDDVRDVIASDTHTNLYMFTSLGRVFVRRAYQIPEAGRTARGTNLANIITMEPGERLTSMLPIRDRSADGYLTMITRGGVIKRTPLADFTNINKNGIRAIRLAEGDELIFTAHTRGEDEILIATHEGYAVRFSEADGRSVGRAAAGVIAVRFRTDGDYVAGAAVITPEIKEGGSEWTLVTVTDKGYGKRSEISDYPLHNRGGMGVRCLGDENKGRLAGIATAKEEDDILIITDGGTVIRTPVSGISLYSRTAGGVRLMTLGEGQTIAGFTVYREKPQDDGDTDAVEVEIEPDEDIVKADTHMKMSEDDEEI